MALTVGSRLGHYDVTALIGEGGMGQLDQATDTKLKRQVALKILPEAFAADPLPISYDPAVRCVARSTDRANSLRKNGGAARMCTEDGGFAALYPHGHACWTVQPCRGHCS